MIAKCSIDTSKHDEYIFSIVNLVVLCLSSIISIIGTVYVCLLLKRYKKMRLSINILFLNLFISDTLNVSIPGTLRMYGALCNNFNFIDCQAIISLTKIFGYISILTLIWISLDRYFKLFYFFKYQEFYTLKKLVVLLVCTWLFSIIFCISADTNWKFVKYGSGIEFYSLCRFSDVLTPIYGTVNEIIAILFPILLIFIIYSLIFIKIRNKNRLSSIRGRKFEEGANLLHPKTADSALFLSSISVCLIYIICIMPICIIDITENHYRLKNDLINFYVPQTLVKIFVLMATIYPAVEVILFLIINRKFWESFSTD